MKHTTQTNIRDRRLRNEEDGFTIIELLIATAVFSLVLLIITYGVIHFTNSYYKGVNTSATQATTQNAIESISQAIEFSRNDGTSVTEVSPQSGSAGQPVPQGSNGYLCVGSKEFLFTLGQKYDGGVPGSGSLGTDVGFYELPQSTASCGWPSTWPNVSDGNELLSKNMRVTNLSVTPVSSALGLWQISLGIAYGDSDLLCNVSKNTAQGGCAEGATQNNPSTTPFVSGTDVRCTDTVGSQFCAVANLSAAVTQRIGN